MHIARLLRPFAAGAGLAALAIFAAVPAGAAAASSPRLSKVHTHPMIRLSGNGTTATTVQTLNWAGYAAVPQHSSGSFRFVQASFTVPSVNCTTTPANSFSVHWVGLDGVNPNSNTVEQAGVESDCTGSGPAYSAWWETFPGTAINTVFTLNAGDAVTASVFFNSAPGTHHNQYNLIVTDVTSGQGFNIWKPCGALSCRNNSAEVISEAPSNGTGTVLPLADFGMMNFINAKVTDKSAQKGGISSSNWNHIKIVMVNSSDQTMAAPGSLFGGQAFSNTWDREN
jgi:hypothetical protein